MSETREPDDEDTQPIAESPEGPAGARSADGAGGEGTDRGRFRRSRSDRMLGGVAGGLGRAFGVDPVIFRIGFGLAVFLGGFGVLAYAALWLFTPDDAGERAPVQRSGWAIAAAVVIGIWLLAAPWGGGPGISWGAPWDLAWIAVAALIAAALYVALRRSGGSGATAFLAMAAIALLVIAAASGLATAAAIATAVGGGLAIAIAVIAVGALLVVAALGGRSLRWLAVPAIAIAIGSAVAAGAGLDFEGGVGERSYRPASASSLPDGGYRIGAGRLAVDLRDLDWRPGKLVELDVEAGAGEIVVAVPERVCVDGAARAGIGGVEMLGGSVGGVDIEELADGDPPRGARPPTLGLDASVDIGHIVVLADDDVDIRPGRDARGDWGGQEYKTSPGACAG